MKELFVQAQIKKTDDSSFFDTCQWVNFIEWDILKWRISTHTHPTACILPCVSLKAQHLLSNCKLRFLFFGMSAR